MKIQNLLNESALLKESHMAQGRRILKESCDGLTSKQRKVVEGIYNEMLPLIEASLTADQVKQVFGAVEKQAVASGGSRTAVGAGVDVAKKANEIVNQLGRKLQDTAPVKAFDQKFEQLKAKVAEKFPDLAEKTAGLGEWVKQNPGKSAAVIGVLTALASLAGGPVGGAIAGQVLRGAQELLKGEKLSTAIGKGLKTAAIGWLAGMTMDAVGDMISDIYSKFNPVPIAEYPKYIQMNAGNGLPDTFQDAYFYGTKEDYSQFKAIWADAIQEWEAGNFEAAKDAFDTARDFAETAGINTLNKIALEGDPQEKIALLGKALDGLSAAAQGAAAGATSYDKQGKPQGEDQSVKKKESYYLQTRPLSEGQVYLVFNRVERLDEGPMDLLKKGAGAVGKAASWVGKQATEKITSAKLLASWKLEGSPTDSEELAQFLKGQGVSDEIVSKVYGDMNISVSGSATVTPVDVAAVKKQITGLSAEDKVRLLNFLKSKPTAMA